MKRLFGSPHKRLIQFPLAIAISVALAAAMLVACQSTAPAQQTTSNNQPAPAKQAAPVIKTEQAKDAGGAKETASSKVLPIGGVFELTGSGAGLGIPYSEGVKAAIGEINAAGGIKVGNDTYRIDFRLYDSRGVVADAVSLTEKLISEERVPIIIGPGYSSSAKAIAPITQKAKIIHISTASELAAMLGKPGNERLFMATLPTGGVRGTADLYTKWVVNDIKVKSVALLLPNDDAGKTYTDLFTQKFEELGVKIVSKDSFQHGNQDFYPTLTKIKSLNPDAILFGFSDDDAMPIVRQAKEMGFNGYFIGSPGVSGVPGLQAAKEPISRYVWRAMKDLSSNDPKVQQFVKALKTYAGKDITSSSEYSVHYYTWTHFLANTISKVGSLDWEKINKALHGARYSGLLNIEVDEKGQTRHNFAAGAIENGKIKYYDVPLPTE